MVRDDGTSGARLARLRGGQPLRGWVEELTADVAPGGPGPRRDTAPDDGDVGRGRHAADPDVQAVAVPGGRWRLGGVPPGAAVAVLAVAVVLVVLLGRGGGSDELVVAADAGVPVAATASGGPGDRSGGPAPPSSDASAGSMPVAVGEPVPPASGQAAAAPAPAPVGPLVVHVDGAVARPGVVTLPPGSRVSDAVAAAGGVSADADTRLVNLARLLQDGEQVVVPRPGEVVAAPTGPGAAPPGGPAAGDGVPVGGAEMGAAAGPVDLNAADVTALDALPGIGPVLAQRIVEHRDQQGPFTSVDDLTSVSGIGPAVLSRIRDLVSV